MKNRTYLKYLILLVLIFSFEKIILSQYSIPQNTLDKKRISNWIVAKTNEITKKHQLEILKNINSFYEDQDSNNIKVLKLSKLNDVSIALYQLFDSISFKSNFIISSVINSESVQSCDFIFNSHDLESSIYVNGVDVISDISSSKTFNIKLKKGKNYISIFCKSSGRNSSVFNLQAYSKKFGKIKLYGYDKNKNKTPYIFTQIVDENGIKINTKLNQDGVLNYNLRPGEYRFRIANSKKHIWSKKIRINENETKIIKLFLENKATISGQIFKIDNKTPNVGLQVSLINSSTNEIFESTISDLGGRFIFYPPNGNYFLRFNVNNKYIFHEIQGEKTLFKINSKSYTYENLNYSLPDQNEGSWNKISMFDGMYSNGAMASLITKDKKLIIGTYNGLSIYNGINVKSYNYKDGLPNGFISDLHEDVNGNIWISFGKKGLVKWKEGKVLKHYTAENGLPSNFINALAEDNKGNLVIGTGSGLSIFDGTNFKNFNFTHGIGNGFITALEVVGNNIWIGCSSRFQTSFQSSVGGGLSLFNGKRFKSFDLSDFNIDNSISLIKSIKSDKKGNVWIGTVGGLLMFNGTNFELIRKENGLSGNIINSVFIDDDVVLLGTDFGLNLYKKDRNRAIASSEKNKIPNEKIQSIKKTQDGIYILCSSSGVYLYDPSSFDKISKEDGISATNDWYNGIHDLKNDNNGVLWAGSGGYGLYKIINNKVVKNYNTSNSGIASNFIMKIKIADDGSMWFAHSRGGVSKFSNNIFENMNKKLHIKSGTYVSDIAFSEDGTIWIASNKGLGKYKNDSLIFFDEYDGLIKPFEAADVNIGNNGEIIYSTYGSGMSIYDGKKFTNYSEDNGLKDNRIWDLDIDSKNNYWLALDGKCVQKFDGTKFTHYDLDDGITAGETNSAYVDELDNVWIGTFGGGVCNFDGKYWNSIDSRDGLLENTISAICGTNGSKYWFGSQNGITCYVPKHQTPNVFIEEIETAKGSYKSLQDLRNNESLVQNSRVTFYLNSNSFNTKEEKQKFLVSIIRKGNKNTKIIKSNKFDFFPKKAGKYQLEFQSIDRDMNYSKAEIIDFKITSPWYSNPVTAIPFWGGLITIFSLLFYVTKKYLNQRKYSIQLKEESQRNDREARARLEEKNKEIVDSINYAKRIQDAMMTSETYRKSVIPKSFILFKPKDVVSGDFYWVYKDQENNIFFTVADCTGHGVPGAFMSMIGTSLLNEIIVEKGIKNTNKILDEMRKQIIKSLNQDTADDQKDGMDISLCKLNLKNKTLEFSGAHNPLVLVSGDELSTFKGDSQAVGLETVDKKPFTKHSIKLKKGDMVYIYSDGYQDQFGGDNGKKYMTTNFKKLLLRVSKEDERKQNKLLEKELGNWMKNEAQIDDICVMGLRI